MTDVANQKINFRFMLAEIVDPDIVHDVVVENPLY